jgi:hypothetical protein
VLRSPIVWGDNQLNRVCAEPRTTEVVLRMDTDYPAPNAARTRTQAAANLCPKSPRAPSGGRGSGSACESDGDDSDGQGTPQGGGGVQSTAASARAAEILRGLRGLQASFMRK